MCIFFKALLTDIFLKTTAYIERYQSIRKTMNANQNETFPADDDESNETDIGSLDSAAMAHRQRELLVEGENKDWNIAKLKYE